MTGPLSELLSREKTASTIKPCLQQHARYRARKAIGGLEEEFPPLRQPSFSFSFSQPSHHCTTSRDSGPSQFPGLTPIQQEQPVSTVIDPAPLATLEKPVGITSTGTRNAAYRALFSQWQMAIDPKDRRSPCEQAIEKGLQCLNEKGSLNDLRLMNKPAVLKMIDETNNEYYATLLSLTG